MEVFMKTIAVIFGGRSVEHDISIITALQAMKKIPKGYQIFPVYITHEGVLMSADNLMEAQTYIDFAKRVKNPQFVSIDFKEKCFVILKNNKIKKHIKVDCALLCLHGHGGEDGAIQGLLELASIAYSSCDIASSVLTMDKTLTKLMLAYKHIRNLTYVQFDKWEYQHFKLKILQKIKQKLSFPCIIKPANLGSSVGISICENEAKLEKQIDEAFLYDERVLVEKYLSNADEYSCAVIKINDTVLSGKVGKVKKERFYTFEDKYIKEREEGKVEIEKALLEKIKKEAVASYKACRCNGVVRVDFLYDRKSKTLYVNELNSIPGSLAFNMFDGSFEDLISVLIAEGKEKQERRGQELYKFDSKAIESFIALSGKQRKK